MRCAARRSGRKTVLSLMVPMLIGMLAIVTNSLAGAFFIARVSTEQLAAIAGGLIGKAYASGKFIFVDSDLKFDQPQAEVVFDRDKVRSLGVDMSRAGQDMAVMLGGNYVNRFSLEDRLEQSLLTAERQQQQIAVAKHIGQHGRQLVRATDHDRVDAAARADAARGGHALSYHTPAGRPSLRGSEPPNSAPVTGSIIIA